MPVPIIWCPHPPFQELPPLIASTPPFLRKTCLEFLFLFLFYIFSLYYYVHSLLLGLQGLLVSGPSYTTTRTSCFLPTQSARGLADASALVALSYLGSVSATWG
jgi:hypothetical protein